MPHVHSPSERAATSPPPPTWIKIMIPEKRPKKHKLPVGNDVEPFEIEPIQVSVVKSWWQIFGEFVMMAAAAFLATVAASFFFR